MKQSFTSGLERMGKLLKCLKKSLTRSKMFYDELEKSGRMPILTEERLSNPLSRQEGGSHYKNYKIQPVEFAMVNGLDLCQSNVIKYTCRFRDKGGKEDLLKARHYIDLLIEFEYPDDRNE